MAKGIELIYMTVIDRENGTIRLGEGFTVTPRLTKSAFLASSWGKRAAISVNNPPCVSYICRQGPASVNGATLLYFNGQRLFSVQLCLRPEAEETEWLSVEYQQENRELHPRFLLNDLGQPPYEYGWGKVVAGCDDRTGYLNSYIWIDYQWSMPVVA